MQFNPVLPSYIIALNQITEEEDLALIKDFYNGEPAKMIGTWNGKSERSYQLQGFQKIDFAGMKAVLRFTNQTHYIVINFKAEVKLVRLPDQFDYYGGATSLGKMAMIKEADSDRTYCPITKQHWKALK